MLSFQFKKTILLFCTCFSLCSLTAQIPEGSAFIHLDQFGYQPNAKKVAVISDPVEGFNGAKSFSPSDQYELRRVNTGEVVWSGSPVIWKGGEVHEQSGDKGWWLDFSEVNSTGTYHLYDTKKQVYSHPFRIAQDVYQEVLKQAVRTYFYQRVNFEKKPPYVDARWQDDACFEGANQDRGATSRWDKGNVSTAKDLRGGWMDAGDVNQYTTFARSVVIQLMQAYRFNPDVFGDDFNIPESGNGIPDLIDEVMYELDWLKRMQDATGTNGFLLKLGVDNHDAFSPPSTDPRPRYYLPECTSATLSGCAMFAASGAILNASGLNSLSSYSTDLITRAEAAWTRARESTNNFTTFEKACDDGDIKAGDADQNSDDDQLQGALIAAIYLYEATGKSIYQEFVENQYNQIKPMESNWWGPYSEPTNTALLTYATLPGISNTVKNAIRNQKAGMNYYQSINDYNEQTDLYRAHMTDAAHHWGSSNVRATTGNLNFNFAEYAINENQADLYREVGAQYLHYFHGLNPLGIVYLSNMYDYGAEKSINEIYHTWFDDGTIYDHALNSANGPAPGYVVGGPNASFSISTISPPSNQPIQKSYLDWNTGWPENSWEISEPAIYYQSAYILLLSRVIANQTLTHTKDLSSQLGKLTVYPNPTTDWISIDLPASLSAKAQLRLTNMEGVLLQEQSIESGAERVQLDMSVLPEGVYGVELWDGERKWIGKVVRG